jgi:hypothetical protein
MLAFIDVHRLVDRQVDISIIVIIIAHGHDVGRAGVGHVKVQKFGNLPRKLYLKV